MDDKEYLTEEGYKNLKEELNQLVNVEHKEVMKRVKKARKNEDIEENYEYEAAKDEQAIIESRIKELKELLDKAVIIKDEDITCEQVGVGNTVKLKDLNSREELSYKIVGSAEADPLNNKISYKSPIGSSIIEHRAGDKVEADTPSGIKEYEILLIK